jgi:hypothetical protein
MILIGTLGLRTPAHAGEAILNGTVTSAAGEKLAGVTVSAKPVDGTITTTVFTDDGGDYYFPPLPAGSYRVWAQAVTFQTAKAIINAERDVTGGGKQDFVLISEQPTGRKSTAARQTAEGVRQPGRQAAEIVEGEDVAVAGRDEQLALIARQRPHRRRAGIDQGSQEFR